jgi:hypothetical protein
MEEFPINQTELAEKGMEKISREKLIDFAKEKPPQDPEVREMLLRWLEQTSIPEGSSAESVEFIDVAIMQSTMKYRLGFLTKEEVLLELEEAGGMLASEYSDTTELHNKLSQLMYSIEDDTFK